MNAILGPNAKPHISVEMIHQLYENFRLDILSKGRINVSLLNRILSVHRVDQVTSRLCAAMFKDKLLLTKEQEATMPPEKKTYDVLCEILDTERTAAIALVKGMPTSFPIPWIIENPGSQAVLTSSVNPLPTDAASWYGPYLVRSASSASAPASSASSAAPLT